jgi:hypothetical protein
LQVSESDSRLLLGNTTAASLVSNRALLRDRNWAAGRMEKFNPYVVPEPDRLAGLMERLYAKVAVKEERTFWV